jgi:hypothetical protein
MSTDPKALRECDVLALLDRLEAGEDRDDARGQLDRLSESLRVEYENAEACARRAEQAERERDEWHQLCSELRTQESRIMGALCDARDLPTADMVEDVRTLIRQRDEARRMQSEADKHRERVERDYAEMQAQLRREVDEAREEWGALNAMATSQWRDACDMIAPLRAVAESAREVVASVDASGETDWDCEAAVDELHMRSERAQHALRNAISALDAATKGET